MATEIIFNPGRRKHKRGSSSRRRKGVVPPQLQAHLFRKGHNSGSRRSGRRHKKSNKPKSYSFGYNSIVSKLNYATPAPTAGLQGLWAGYKPETLMAALPYVLGAFGSSIINRTVAPKLPTVLQRGAGNLALGLGTAGSMAVATNFVSKTWARGVLLGGVAAVIAQAVSMFDTKKPMFGFALAGMEGFGGMGRSQYVVATDQGDGMAGLGSSASGSAVANGGGISGYTEAEAGDLIEQEESEF